MNKRLLRIAGLIIVIALVVGSRRTKTTTAESRDSETAPGKDLGQFIEIVNRVNDESDPEYIGAVAQLRAAKSDVINDARTVLSGHSTASFAVRHSTMLAVAALRDVSALDLLSEVAINPQPLPPDPPPDKQPTHTDGSEIQVQHDMLALDALDGIVGLADDGDAQALDVLLRIAMSGSNTIRTVAVAALAARPERRQLLDRARAALPRELSHLGLTRFASVEEVPQIRDPRAHLAYPDRGAPPAPPLAGDRTAPHPRSGPTRGRNAPRVSKEANHG